MVREKPGFSQNRVAVTSLDHVRHMNESCRKILHVDMDAFFAAVEQLDHPRLRGKPVIVGAPPDRRGVVSTASYEARKFGVHSAMPSRTAYRLCPHGVFVPVRMERYRQVSSQVMEIFRRNSAVVEQMSVDEAFLDLSDEIPLYQDAVRIARRVKRSITDELGLTASVGVATNKFLAKVASDLEKPDGLTVVPADPDAVREFLAPLPVGRIWGVGKVTADRLERNGIRTIAQIQEKSRDEMTALLGVKFGKRICRLARGEDERPVRTEKREEKSISHEETFPVDCADESLVRQTLIRLAEKVGRRLRKAGKLAGVGFIKLRFANFRTITRQGKFDAPLNSDRKLVSHACALLDKENVSEPIRLIGFGVMKLHSLNPDPPPRQLLLFEDRPRPPDQTEADLDRAVDHLRAQYGEEVLKRGTWGEEER